MEKKTNKGASTSGENVYAILSYLWVLCLIPILLKKEDPFIRFHARQGLMLFIVEVGIVVVGIVPIFGPVIYTLGCFICGVLSLIGIVQVLLGKKWKMPVIGEWAKKINI